MDTSPRTKRPSSLRSNDSRNASRFSGETPPDLKRLGKPNGDKGIAHKCSVGGYLDTKGPLDLEAGTVLGLRLPLGS